MADINVIINNIENKVRATVLTGLNISLTGTISDTDTVLQAFGRLQNQITNIDLSGYLPYSGATQDLNMGLFSVAATSYTATGLTADRLVQTNGVKALASATGTGLVRLTAGVISYDTSSYITLTSLSSTATGLTYTNTTGVFSLTAGYVIPTTSQIISTFTTTGSSGAATYSSGTLNIPTYTLTGLGGFANPMTTLGDIIYGGASGVATRLSGNTTTARQFLTSTGSGGLATAPPFFGATFSFSSSTTIVLTL